MAGLYTLETRRLRIRPCTPGDVDALQALWTDPLVRKYLWDGVAISREQTASVLASSTAWVICLREQPEVIGHCAFRFSGEPSQAELLYALAPPYWGQGLATEAAQAMLRHGFEKLQIERIIAGTDVPNIASARVLEKLGMKFERYVLNADRKEAWYAMTRRDFQCT